MKIIRKIIALAVGIIVCSIAVGLVQQLGHFLYPMPENTNPNDVEAVKKYMETAPFMAVFFVIISYAAGALSGGFISTLIAGDSRKIYAIIIGILFLLVSVYMMITIPSPIWFWISGIAVWGLVLAGYRLALKVKKV